MWLQRQALVPTWVPRKFLNIKCGYSGLSPHAIVLVATVRALKYHGGKSLKELTDTDPGAVERGLPNLEKHLENMNQFGVPVVVAINKFVSDSPEEIKVIQDRCESWGVRVAVSEGWEHGGAGTMDLASEVAAAADGFSGRYKPLYDWKLPVEDKIFRIAKNIYGADTVVFQPKAKLNLKRIHRLGLNELPVCIAKTQKSFSDKPTLIGRPEGFELVVREIEIAAGAGFLIPITGQMLRMPGLPSFPAAENMDIDNEGRITGLS